MLVLKELILFVVTIVFTTSVNAGHKRVIINVPQRTRHIYHHHVKKVPVYVLIPNKKPKILDDLEIHQPKPTKPCKDYEYHGEPSSAWQEDREDNRYRYARYNDHRGSGGGGERDSYLPEWAEDREHKGTFVPAPGNFRNIDREVPPPLPTASIDDDELPFRRTVAAKQIGEKPRAYPVNRQVRNEGLSPPPPPPPTHRAPFSHHREKLTRPIDYRQTHQNAIAAIRDNDNNDGDNSLSAGQSSSYQYQIGHRASYDNLIAED